jgi:hypothetical protein
MPEFCDLLVNLCEALLVADQSGLQEVMVDGGHERELYRDAGCGYFIPAGRIIARGAGPMMSVQAFLLTRR